AAVVTSASNEEQTRQLIEQNVPEQDATQSVQSSSDELSLSIASLRAQLDLQRQAYAKRPRKYTISSASTKKSQDALYLDNWRKRIEAIGNLNYPDAARRQQLYGNLRLLVSILPDGVVEEIRILQSSGHSILDQAALGIVQLAAPFQPFPDELRETVDILEIIRTWRFHERTGLTSY
ncbi:MAG TPA: energy transducer TonB, partial [Gammaproteobacteria bacterium]|nr:energy transducer TonB [Gammaproteobacteria bacterium]